MGNDKKPGFEFDKDQDSPASKAQRARNRTVMLTPELTSAVRDRVAKESGGYQKPEDIIPGLSYNRKEEKNESGGFSFGKPAWGETPKSDQEPKPFSFGTPAATEEDTWTKTEGAFEDTKIVEKDDPFSKPLNQQFRSGGLQIPDSLKAGTASWKNENLLSKDEPVKADIFKTEIPDFGRMDFTEEDSIVMPETLESEVAPVIPNYAAVQEPIYTKPIYTEPVKPAYEEPEVLAEVAPTEGVFWERETPLVGFLVSFDRHENGEYYVLRTGRLVISNEVPTAGSYLLLEDDSVSPMHAVLRVGKDGKIQILDQLSESGTKIIKANHGGELDLSGDKTELQHGDLIILGNRQFALCVIDLTAV